MNLSLPNFVKFKCEKIFPKFGDDSSFINISWCVHAMQIDRQSTDTPRVSIITAVHTRASMELIGIVLCCCYVVLFIPLIALEALYFRLKDWQCHVSSVTTCATSPPVFVL